MSMSEMSKARYLKLRESVRTNGLAYTVRTMCSVLEKEDVRAVFDADVDLLHLRAMWAARPMGDSAKTIIRCTTPVGERFRAPLP